MNRNVGWLSNNGYVKGGMVFVLLGFLFAGCATAPATFDPNIKGPQMIVEPACVNLNVSTVMGTPIVFKGKGFQPGDSVFIELLGVKKGGKDVKVPIADAEVGPNGEFTAPVSTLAKATELLRATLGSNAKMETTIILSEPTIPPGVYTAKAVSMDSDKTAESKLTLNPPSGWGNFKD
ncbi:MAG TPA: hypothetical protein ENO25_06550, partial [Desulfobacteraceae bacterium]|nr:hypothetical protein [Desulfobacteraceae bacterium]